MSSSVFSVSIGIDRPPCRRLERELDFRSAQRVQYLTVPLFHPRLRRDREMSAVRTGPQTRSDRVIPCRDWAAAFVGKASPWIDCDNASEALRRASEDALREELCWANHLGLRTVILPEIKNVNSFAHGNYVRMLQKHLAQSSPLRQALVLPVPLVLPLVSQSDRDAAHDSHTHAHDALENEKSWDGWHLWNVFRTQLGYDTQLSLALTFSEEVADFADSLSDHYLSRWIAEPVKTIVLPTALFVMNESGYPVLSKLMQNVVRFFLKHSIGVLFSGPSRHSSGDMVPYVAYIRHLQQKEESLLAEEDKMFRGYLDALQSPLQPLMDNLEAQTYETFEQDPVKYARYEAAVAKALQHVMRSRLEEEKKMDDEREHKIEEEEKKMQIADDHSQAMHEKVIVMVVGAGRGPLVAATLSAAASTQIPVQVFAVEKNANAVITLRNRVIQEKWEDQVTIVATDMRQWTPPVLADVLVSELLGSFGDNELSPECLDGAQKRLLKRGGLSVPERYTSFLQPVTCPLHWMAAREMFQSSSGLALTSSAFQAQFSSATSGALKGLETPYVVKFYRFCPLDSVQRCWDFVHPNRYLEHCGKLPDNSRYARLRFESDITAAMHGFAGYFHCDLFEDEVISIEPRSFSKGMFSWFPIYFPLTKPVLVHKGDSVVVDIWRCCDDHRVWYEWCLVSPTASEVHNIQGRSSCVGL